MSGAAVADTPEARQQLSLWIQEGRASKAGMAKAYLEAGVELPRNAVLMAVAANSLEMLDVVLEYGGDPSVKDTAGCGALMHAVIYGQMQITWPRLLSLGLDPLERDLHADTPLGLAITEGREIEARAMMRDWEIAKAQAVREHLEHGVAKVTQSKQVAARL
jgi:hypothetical protein